MKHTHFVIFITISLVAGFNCSKQTKGSSISLTSDSLRVKVINDSSLSKATYYIASGPTIDTIKLTDGTWKGQYNDLPGDTTYENLNLQTVAYGDLNGDGKLDAAVVLRNWTGGSGIFVSLNAVLDSNNHPTHSASADLGDRTILDSIWIDSSIIKVKTRGYLDEDSIFTKFKLVGNKLKQISNN
jgi:hypothetical protein